MGGRNVVGHFLTVTPLSPVPCQGKAPADGWSARCKCGWQQLPFPTKVSAEKVYREHKLSSLPICSKCNGIKQQAEMSVSHPSICKKCSTSATRAWAAANPKQWERSLRKSWLRKKYGISPEDFDRMLDVQRGVCALCGEGASDSRGFRPHVDHCHETGKVRGILCGPCNRGIGQFKDSIELLQKAIRYLRKHKKEVIK